MIIVTKFQSLLPFKLGRIELKWKKFKEKNYFILFKYQNKKPLQIQTKKERVGGFKHLPNTASKTEKKRDQNTRGKIK